MYHFRLECQHSYGITKDLRDEPDPYSYPSWEQHLETMKEHRQMVYPY